MGIVFITGAGISVPSGIPAYRSAGSGWDNKRLEEISQYTRYGNHLDELWKFWTEQFRLVMSSRPNKAHEAISSFVHEQGGSVLTQNIDGLHGDIAVELHGTIWNSKCIRCKFKDWTESFLWSGNRFCPRCLSDRVRPDVTLFGEGLRREARQALKEAERANCAVFVGTSGSVHPCAGLVERVRDNGGRTVLLNDQEWGTFDEVILGDVEEIVPEYVERILNA